MLKKLLITIFHCADVVFELNGKKVHKSEIQKKTLKPTWNENFEVSVPSRVAAKFTMTIYDWDRVGTDEKLGSADIDLASLEPMESQEIVLNLKDETGNASNAGTCRLRLIFRPGFIVRSRAATSTFSSAGRALTSLGGAGVGAIGTGVGAGAGLIGAGVGAGVGAGATVIGAGVGGIGSVGKGVFSGIKKVGSFGSSNGSPAKIPEVPEVPVSFQKDVAPVSQQVAGNNGSPRRRSSANVVRPHGLLKITVVSIDGVGEPEEKKFITINYNGKELDSSRSVKGDSAELDESFVVKATSEPLELAFTLL
jgi:hypothetical protein